MFLILKEVEMECPDPKKITLYGLKELPESFGILEQVRLIEHILKCQKCKEHYMNVVFPPTKEYLR